MSTDNISSDNSSYRILMVDDEEPFRVGLKFAINWKELGFKIAGEASNVQDAIKLMEDNYYDIVLTDIQMPEKSGLDLVQIVKEKYPKMRVFILSGYDYFDYAVSAIKMGVEDYILKPIKKDSLIDRFKKLKNDIDKEKAEDNRKIIGSRMARSNFFDHLVQNDYTSKEKILSIVDKLEVNVPDNGMCIINLKLDDLYSFIDKNFSGSTDNFCLYVEHNVDNMFDNSYKPLLMTFINNNFILLASYEHRELYVKALAMYMEKLSDNYAIGVGEKVDSIDYVPVSYHQAIEAIKLNTDNKVSHYSYDSNHNHPQLSQLILLHKKIIDAIEGGISQEVRSLTDKVFLLLEGSNIDFIYNWSINSIHEILEYFEIEKIQKFPINYYFDFSSIDKKNLYESAKASYLKYLNQIGEILKNYSTEPNRDIVKKSLEVIDKNYSNKEFTLYDVANVLNISYGYLCTIFKQITGQNFTDYLISIRMKHARTLILEGDNRMYEIADKVGYSSARYFAMAFRRYFGVNPTDYKKRMSS